MRRFRDEQEEQSGTIRRDPVGVRGRRDDQSAGEEAWGAPTNGAPGDRQFDPARAKEARAGTTETRSGEGGYRPDAGRRPAGAAEATAHGTPHLDTAARRAPGPSDRGANRAAIRAATETRNGTGPAGRGGAAELRLGPRRPSGLVWGDGQTGWGTVQVAVVRDAQYGVGRRVSPGLYQRHAASVAGRTRARFRLLRRRVSHVAL